MLAFYFSTSTARRHAFFWSFACKVRDLVELENGHCIVEHGTSGESRGSHMGYYMETSVVYSANTTGVNSCILLRNKLRIEALGELK